MVTRLDRRVLEERLGLLRGRLEGELSRDQRTLWEGCYHRCLVSLHEQIASYRDIEEYVPHAAWWTTYKERKQ